MSFLSEFVTSNLTSHHHFSHKAQSDSHNTILIPRASLSLVSDGSITNRVMAMLKCLTSVWRIIQNTPSFKKNQAQDAPSKIFFYGESVKLYISTSEKDLFLKETFPTNSKVPRLGNPFRSEAWLISSSLSLMTEVTPCYPSTGLSEKCKLSLGFTRL